MQVYHRYNKFSLNLQHQLKIKSLKFTKYKKCLSDQTSTKYVSIPWLPIIISINLYNFSANCC